MSRENVRYLEIKHMHRERDSSIAIDKDGHEIRIPSLMNTYLDVIKRNLVSLDISHKIKEVYCARNLLTRLEVPNNIVRIDCEDNQLTELILHEGIQHVYCFNNQLTELHLPNTIISVNCTTNKIKNINFPKSLAVLYCDAESFDYEVQLHQRVEIEVFYDYIYDRF